MSEYKADFEIGKMYESTSHGMVVYLGLDTFMGQVSFEFKSIKHNKVFRVLPTALDMHFKNEEQDSVVNDTLSASEAVYGLLAWLTCRKTAVTFSAKHNAVIAAELADEFCKANSLIEPRDDYHTNLIHPTNKRIK